VGQSILNGVRVWLSAKALAAAESGTAEESKAVEATA
jgi:hypothetical protein